MQRESSKIDITSWIIACFSLLAIAALFMAGKATLLRIAIPAACTVLGFSLYLRKPVEYLRFTLWVWLLTPMVRRIVDSRVGFADQNLVLLSPLLVSFITILTVVRYRRDPRVAMGPFILCAVGILYGLLVGLAMHPKPEVIYGFVNWMAPILLGLHLYLTWPELEANSEAVRKTAVWGLLFIGVYGIVQFYYPPAWDTMWLESLPGGLESSTFGRPLPQEIRVWSTLNAPGPFANVATALLLLTTLSKSKVKLPAMAAGFAAIILSLVRTAWLTGIVAFLFLAKNSNRKAFVYVMLAFAGLGIGATVLANSSLDIPVIGERLKTLGDLKNDESVQDRWRLYTNLSTEVLQQPVGIGLNNSDFYKGYPLDSGPIRMLLNLGWFGTIAYLVGIAQLLTRMFRQRDKKNPLQITCLSIVLMFLLQLASGLTFINVSGAMMWIVLGLGLSSSVATEKQTARIGALGTHAPMVQNMDAV